MIDDHDALLLGSLLTSWCGTRHSGGPTSSRTFGFSLLYFYLWHCPSPPLPYTPFSSSSIHLCRVVSQSILLTLRQKTSKRSMFSMVTYISEYLCTCSHPVLMSGMVVNLLYVVITYTGEAGTRREAPVVLRRKLSYGYAWDLTSLHVNVLHTCTNIWTRPDIYSEEGNPPTDMVRCAHAIDHVMLPWGRRRAAWQAVSKWY